MAGGEFAKAGIPSEELQISQSWHLIHSRGASLLHLILFNFAVVYS